MKLVLLEIDGYRRFRSKQKLQLDCRLVALLGPNEAGKTSVLRALQKLNDDSKFATDGPSRDITRNLDLKPDHLVVSARFLLEESDFELLREIPEATAAKWLIVEKPVSGQRLYRFEPPIKRDLSLRREVVDLIGVLASEKESTEVMAEIAHRASTVIDAVPNEDVETLPAAAIKALKELVAALERTPSANPYSETRSDIEKLITLEEKENPSTAAHKQLAARFPQFVVFEDEDRNLASNYDLNTFFNEQKRSPIPRALENLTATAKLSLEDLFQSLRTNDQGKIETDLSGANELLKEKMSQAWNQSGVEVRFRLNGNQLSILVGTNKSGFENISERSDGLRQFVALFSSLSRRIKKGRDVVLLIDEAELHLHYDAQADLVQMLAKQSFAKKVIFTTHSIGCLPEDLGSGVRLIEPIDEGSSSIVNKFWAKGGSGLSPVLFGMGAATMAFLPIRFCVLTEGATDMLLLPPLLREVTAKDTLGFQVSPGLAEAGERQIAILQSEGSRVVYLVDGDAAGNEIQKKLKRAGISELKIVRLSQDTEEESCVIEDFIDETIYTDAVNQELVRSGCSKYLLASDLPSSMRPRMVEEWCATIGVAVPNKVNVAYRVLEKIYEHKLARVASHTKLSSIYSRIMAAFNA